MRVHDGSDGHWAGHLRFLSTYSYRGHPNGGEETDPAESAALKRLRDRAAQLQREEGQADCYMEVLQGILNSMSEDSECKRFIIISSICSAEPPLIH